MLPPMPRPTSPITPTPPPSMTTSASQPASKPMMVDLGHPESPSLRRWRTSRPLEFLGRRSLARSWPRAYSGRVAVLTRNGARHGRDGASRAGDGEIPIIFITGHGDIPMSVKAMKAGAVDFLAKPFAGKDLLDAIRRAVAKDTRNLGTEAREDQIRARVKLLTPRESQVFALVVTGMLNKQIASELGIGEKTVRVHRARVMEKMQAGSVAALVRLADAVRIIVTKA